MSTANPDRLYFETYETEEGGVTLGWSLMDTKTRMTMARSRGHRLGAGGRLIGPGFEVETRIMDRFFRDPLVRQRLIACLEAEGL